MTTDLDAVPREVWRGFVDGGGLDRVELMRYSRPLTGVRLEPATAQQEADNQRLRFQRLIVELFPLDRGMLNQALGKRGWLNMVFDKVVEDQRMARMATYLEQVVARGNRLSTFAERAPGVQIRGPM